MYIHNSSTRTKLDLGLQELNIQPNRGQNKVLQTCGNVNGI